jgi:hypothetical protein
VDCPSHKTEAQGRLGVVAGERKSLIHRPDRCNIGIDGVCKCGNESIWEIPACIVWPLPDEDKRSGGTSSL